MITVLILGPGYPDGQKEMREEIVRLLNAHGEIRAIIMEALNLDEKIPLHERFFKMIEEQDPDLIVAMYTKDGSSDAVDFELGALCCKNFLVAKSLVVIVEIGKDVKSITRYIREGLYKHISHREYTNTDDAAWRIISEVNHIKNTANSAEL